MYKRTIPLAFPVDTASGRLTSLTVSTLPAAQHRGIAQQYDLNNDPDGFNYADFEFDVAQAMSGLPAEALLQLAQPDYNSLMAEVRNLCNNTSRQLLEDDHAERRKAGENLPPLHFDENEPSLLVPLSDPIAGEVNRYTLRPPSVGLTRQVRGEKDAHKQGMLIASACTGLHHDVLDQFHVPDFNYLMERVSDFLTEKSDFFLKPTSTD